MLMLHGVDGCQPKHKDCQTALRYFIRRGGNCTTQAQGISGENCEAFFTELAIEDWYLRKETALPCPLTSSALIVSYSHNFEKWRRGN